MAAPTFKKATDSDAGDSTKYGAPDLKYALDAHLNHGDYVGTCEDGPDCDHESNSERAECDDGPVLDPEPF